MQWCSLFRVHKVHARTHTWNHSSLTIKKMILVMFIFACLLYLWQFIEYWCTCFYLPVLTMLTRNNVHPSAGHLGQSVTQYTLVHACCSPVCKTLSSFILSILSCSNIYIASQCWQYPYIPVAPSPMLLAVSSIGSLTSCGLLEGFVDSARSVRQSVCIPADCPVTSLVSI